MSGKRPRSRAMARSADTCERRRRLLLLRTAGRGATARQIADPAQDLYGNRAIANLLLGRHARVANARLRRCAEWFEHPHPTGRDHRGECTFVAMKLCRAWHLFKGREELEPATRESIRGFFLERNFRSKHQSENHLLLWRTSRYLMAGELRNETLKAWRRRGRTLEKTDREWLAAFIRYRARRGWGEFDSPCYIKPDWECLLAIHDYAPDAELRRLARDMLDLLLLDAAVDSLGAMHCGAHGRIYAPHALDHSTENSWPLNFLYFGNLAPVRLDGGGTLVDALVSGYRPGKIVLDVALNRRKPYENRERKHLHNVADVKPARPLGGSIRKYTWWTPEYVMGCVQKQDPYPARCRGRWYAHHEQHQWDLSFATGPRARLFTHHPGKSGPEHGYWTGDIRCGCGHFFQNRTALVALYEIPGDQPCQLIHAYVPRSEFDEVVEEGGWIFVRAGRACAALRMLGGHRWSRDMKWTGDPAWKRVMGPHADRKWETCEVLSPGGHNGAVCEAGLLADFGGFSAFRREIVGNPLEFDKERMRLTYESSRAGRLEIDTRGTRRLDGRPADLDYATYDCPYLRSKWDSGVIEVRTPRRRACLDFREKRPGRKKGTSK